MWGAALFVVTLSLGESFWSPRWYDYSMSLAPYGREGIFTALASAPLFAAKLPTGQSLCCPQTSCNPPMRPSLKHATMLCYSQRTHRRCISASVCRKDAQGQELVLLPTHPASQGCIREACVAVLGGHIGGAAA